MERFGTVSIVKKFNLKRTDKTLSVLYPKPFRKFVYITMTRQRKSFGTKSGKMMMGSVPASALANFCRSLGKAKQGKSIAARDFA